MIRSAPKLTRSILTEMIAGWGGSVTAVASLPEAGPIERYQVAVAALDAVADGQSLASLPVPALVLHGASDRMPRVENSGPGFGRTAPVRTMRAPVRSAELLDTLLTLLSPPVPEARPGATGQQSTGPSPFPQLRILVADDNRINQRVAALLLERLGCSVEIAVDGVQAVEMWSNRPYDMVFMDCQMPEQDGFEATAAIRRAERGLGTHIPIIAMTANAMTGDREQCLRAGMDSYVPKPVSAEQFGSVLHEFAHGIPSVDRTAQS